MVYNNKHIKMKSALKETLETVIIAFAIFLALQTTLMGFIVEGSSMSPSLFTGEKILVNKAVYLSSSWDIVRRITPNSKHEDENSFIFHPPQRGDIICFYFPRDIKQIYIKRIIGLPGETVEIRNGKVLINDSVIKEPSNIPTARNNYGPITVPPKQYFVMGDNRNGSSDSRGGWTVPKDNIIGKAWLIYWPLPKWGLAPNFKLASSGSPLTLQSEDLFSFPEMVRR
ncbi:MAG: signal peptidase I [Dehalococcoidia bacterium]|nr:signal peptidase I [Dehalococcoidia bacterium]